MKIVRVLFLSFLICSLRGMESGLPADINSTLCGLPPLCVGMSDTDLATSLREASLPDPVLSQDNTTRGVKSPMHYAPTLEEIKKQHKKLRHLDSTPAESSSAEPPNLHQSLMLEIARGVQLQPTPNSASISSENQELADSTEHLLNLDQEFIQIARELLSDIEIPESESDRLRKLARETERCAEMLRVQKQMEQSVERSAPTRTSVTSPPVTTSTISPHAQSSTSNDGFICGLFKGVRVALRTRNDHEFNVGDNVVAAVATPIVTPFYILYKCGAKVGNCLYS